MSINLVRVSAAKQLPSLILNYFFIGEYHVGYQMPSSLVKEQCFMCKF